MDSSARGDASSKRPRITPRNSESNQTEKDTTVETPWQTLHQLANLPRTPLRRASSAGPPSTRPSQRRTPFARTPALHPRLGSARRPIAVTPHGRAAQRELDIRRTGMTPGNDRRRSIRQRNSPRDTLRDLSRLLAPKSKPIEYTPEAASLAKGRSAYEQDDLDDGPDPERPRLSLALGFDDDDDSLLLPPKSAGLEDEDVTLQSTEFGRRAYSEQPLSRLSRGSFGTVRLSTGLGDVSRLDDLSEAYDLSVFGDDGRAVPFLGGDMEDLQGENTGVLRGLGLDRARLSLASGRESGIQPIGTGLDDTETFVFNVPLRNPTDDPLSPPAAFDTGGDVDDAQVDVADEDENEEAEEEGEGMDVAGDADEQDEPDVSQLDEGMSVLETVGTTSAALQSKAKSARRKKVKISKHGLQYPSLPAGVVKKLATGFARNAGNSKARLSKETLDAVLQASDWFFEQVSEDLGAYSAHAGRKTIEESDVVTLLTRQRQTNTTITPFSLAQKHLPRELLQELRMVPPSKFNTAREVRRGEEE